MTQSLPQIDLNAEWAKDMAGLGIDNPSASDLLIKLLGHYGEDGRHYHGIGHLRALFALLEQHAPQPIASAVRLAIWWHDVIYDPTARDNEERSAVMARADLFALGANEVLVQRVVDLILASKNHFDAQSFNGDDVFLDADIAILGAPPLQYRHYVEQIRNEYHIVPPQRFDAGRLAFLKHAATKTPMFKTDLFEAHYGDQARANMAGEIGELEAKIAAS